MRWKMALSLVICLVLTSSTWAQTAPDVVSQLPEHALGFALVKNLSELNDKIVDLAKKVQNPLPQSPIDMLDAFGFGKGLDRKGGLMVVLVQTEDETSPWGAIIYVPVTDYKDFVTSIGGKAEDKITPVQLGFLPFLAAKRGKYCVLAKADQMDSLKKALASTALASSELLPVQSWITENDISVVATTKGVKVLSKVGRKGLGDFRENTPIPDDTKALANMFDAINSWLKTSETDVSHLAFGNRIDQAGNYELAGKAFFTKDSAFAKQTNTASQTASLSGLPVIPYVFALGGSMSDSTMKSMMSLNNDMLKAMFKDAPKEKLKKLDTASADFAKQMTSMSMVMGSGKGDEPLFASMYGIMKVNDAKSYFKSYEEYLKIYNEVIDSAKPGSVPVQKFETKSLTVDGKPALQVTSEMKIAENLGEMGEKMQKFYFGPDGKMVVMQVIADPKTIVTSYSSDSINAALKTYQDKKTNLADEASVRKTIALLPTGSQFIMLLSPKGLTEVINRGVERIVPEMGIKVPIFPETPAIGIAVKRASTTVEGRFIIPVNILESVGEYIQRIQRMRGNVRIEETR